MREIAIIIPAFNEEASVATVLKKLPRTIKLKGTNYSVLPIVVDDGSSDATREKVRKVKHTCLIQHLQNYGAGAATRTGLHYARLRPGVVYAATMDADGQHKTEDVLAVIKKVAEGKANIIVGSRLVNTEGMPVLKVLGNKGLNLMTRLVLGVKTTDSQSGLKGFDRTAIEQLDFRENGYAFCSELLWRASRVNLTIDEVPIQAVYTAYSKAKGQSNWNALQIIKQMLKRKVMELVNG